MNPLGAIKAAQVIFTILVLVKSIATSGDENIKRGFTEVLKEFSDTKCTVQSGHVPDWIEGYLLRQTCGSFGHIDSEDPHEKLAHWLDCIGMAATYKFQKGEVKFSSRYYDTRSYNIWKQFGRDLKKSRVSWRTIFSPYDAKRAADLVTNFTDKIDVEPTVTFWNLGSPNRVLAVTETTYALELDLQTLDNIGIYSYKEDMLQSSQPGVVYINNPAHEHTDRDGTIWSMTGMFQFTGPTNGVSKYIVYTVKDGVRSVVGSHPIGEWDLQKCVGSEYPDLSVRPGYMHGFGLTENYVVLLVTSWLMDYCNFFAYQKPEPLLLNGYQWHGDHSSRVIVMRKSDGSVLADVPVDAFMITHMLNTYEEDGFIHMDAVFYPDSSVIDSYTFIQRVIHAKDMWHSSVERITIRESDWSFVSRRHLTKTSPVIRDFPAINYAYSNGKPYMYGYLVDRLMKHNSSIVKLNVRTGEEWSWTGKFGVFPQEAIFVARPNATSEDDGVLLSGGIDSALDKGFVVVIDARTMKELAYVTAPERTLIGIHNKFIPVSFNEGESHQGKDEL